MTATKLKLGVVSAVIVTGVLIVFLLQREGNDSTSKNNLTGHLHPKARRNWPARVFAVG